MKINLFVQQTFLNCFNHNTYTNIYNFYCKKKYPVNKVKYNFQALLNYINCKYGNLLNCLFFYISVSQPFSLRGTLLAKENVRGTPSQKKPLKAVST